MTSNPNSNAPPGQRAFDRHRAFDQHLAFERHRAFDRHRAASSLGCSSDDSDETLFFEAIYQQRDDIVQLLPVEQILPFIDSVDGRGRTPLMHSVSLGDLNTCRILLQLGCDVNKTDKAAWTALHHAAKSGYEDIFTLLLDNKANPDCFTRNNYTPLYIAILYEHIGIISILKSVSKSINSRESGGRTSLNLAIENEMTWETIKILLDMGADPNIQNERGENPVLCAVNLGMFEIASRIIEHSMIPFTSYNCTDLNGQSILHAAVQNNTSLDIFKTHLGDFDLNIENPQENSPLLAALELGYVHIAKELIIAGADINQTDPSGKTPLYIAAREGHEEIIFDLSKRGNSVSLCSHHFLPTALHVAVHKKHERNLILKLLLRNKELEIPNDNGQTPLLLAMEMNNAHAVNVLVKFGVNVDIADNDGDTPIEILRRSVNLNLFAAYLGELDFYEAGQTDDVLTFAIEKNMVEYVEALLQNGAKINEDHCEKALSDTNNDNTIAEMLLKYMLLSKKMYNYELVMFSSAAVRENNVEMINKISQSGIELNKSIFYHPSPLVIAITENMLVAAEALFQVGCDFIYTDENEDKVEKALAENQSMKDLCSKYGLRIKNRVSFDDMNATSLMEFIEKTISSGKGLSDIDSFGNSVLHRAATLEDLEILKLVINNGIDINIQNRFGKTALHIAASKNFIDEVEFLLARGADLNIKDYSGDTPLWDSVNKVNIESSLKLLDAGATTTKIKYDKNFVQHVVSSGSVRLLQELSNRNITPNLIARDVQYVSYIDDERLKKEMLEYFIDVFRDGDKNGENALFGALYERKLVLMEDILKLDPSLVNSVNKNTGESLLHGCIDRFPNKNDFIRLLLVVEEQGGDLDKVYINQTPLEKCIRYNRFAEVALLVSKKADCTQNAMSLASTRNQKLLFQMLVDAGATPPPCWPRQVLSLKQIAVIACRKYIPQKGFRGAIKSLKLGSFQATGLYDDILLLKNQYCKILKMAKCTEL